MKKEIREDSRNYVATIVKIKEILPIEGADKIGVTYINGNPVIVQKDLDTSKLFVYFTALTELSDDLCKRTNSYTKSEMNNDVTKRGFIEPNRRVKIIKLKGVYSNGMILPISFFPQGLQEGDEFNSIDGVEYCRKFIIHPTVDSVKGVKKDKAKKQESRLIEGQFQFHINTSHLAKNLHQIKPNTVIEVSEKLHGSSIIISNILTKRKLTFKDKVAKYFGAEVKETEYDIIYSSRKVIKNSAKESGYYNEDIWKVVKDDVGHLIPKGVTLYGEIIGYTKSGQAIQKKYDYGCKNAEHKFVVYRITTTNEDGVVLEWSPIQIEEFCDKRGLLFSEYFIFYGRAKHLIGYDDERDFGEKFLQFCIENYTEMDCSFCYNKVPREGVVVRFDSGEEYKAFKLKSQRFILGENKAQEEGETNMEDEQGN